MTRIEKRNDGDVVYVSLDPTGIRDHAEFVHPFIAVDFDEAGRAVGFSASGPAVDSALDTYKLHRNSSDPEALVAALRTARLAVPA